MSIDSTRAARLKKTFDATCRGTQLTSRTYLLFLEAICLVESDAAATVNRLISSPNGLQSLQWAMRYDLSPAFCNGWGSRFLEYISSPDVAAIGGGDFLRRVLLAIIEPPIFWAAFSQAFLDGHLDEKAQSSFGFLLLHILHLFPSDTAARYLEFAEDSRALALLTSSPNQAARSYGEKIKLIVDAHRVGTIVDLDFAPGGRHDNDKADYRDISILPTADEIKSQQAPFLRTASALEDPAMESTRMADYLDNQFRLLREDMIYEMREEMQIALGKKRKGHRNVPVDDLALVNVHFQKDDQGSSRRQSPWTIALQRNRDFAHMAKVAQRARVAWYKDNRWFLKHGAMACIIIDDDLSGFATIDRNEDLLAKPKPIITLQLEGQAIVSRVLHKFKTAKSIKLVQIDTALFAYEPVLKALQEMSSVPLSEELLFWNEEDGPVVIPQLSGLVSALRQDPSQDLQGLLNLSKSVKLDDSQSQSLLAGLTQSLSLIQGPPGYVILLICSVLRSHTTV
jgi:hypothetical protein